MDSILDVKKPFGFSYLRVYMILMTIMDELLLIYTILNDVIENLYSMYST